MRFAPTPDQLALHEGLADLLGDICTPDLLAAVAASEDGRSQELWSALTDMGLLGLEGPEAVGGLGMGPMETELAMEAAGRFAVPEPLISTAAVAVPILAASDTPEAADAVAGAIGGATVAYAALGQPNVLHAATAQHLLLTAADGLYLLDPAKVTLTAVTSVDRARRLSAVEWSPADGVKVGDEALAAAAADRAALAAAAQLVGLADAMVALTVGYVSERTQFGVPIGSFQAVKHHLANAELAVSFARPLVRRAAYSVALGDPDARVHVSMAKAQAGDAAELAGRLTLQCHGAIAYTVEYAHQWWLKRVWALRGRFGTSTQHRARVAQHLLDAPH